VAASFAITKFTGKPGSGQSNLVERNEADKCGQSLENCLMWRWRRKPVREDFPEDFKVQRIGVRAALEIADHTPEQIVTYFRQFPAVAEALLTESCDKRYSPSTFITEENCGYSVGWYSKGYHCVARFSNLADAATDYLLFSLGKGRWAEAKASNSN
jgi:hypothetical protein